MLVDVTFDGVSLVKGANARPDGNGWFVELEQPMPVGTLLQLSGEAQAAVRVEHVTEGVGAGMSVLPAGAVEKRPPDKAQKSDQAESKAAAPLPPPAAAPPAAAAPKAAVDKAAAETPAEAAADAKKSEGDEDDADGPKGSNGAAGKERRKKPRKTVMGH